jgi:hypothetical protein
MGHCERATSVPVTDTQVAWQDMRSYDITDICPPGLHLTVMPTECVWQWPCCGLCECSNKTVTPVVQPEGSVLGQAGQPCWLLASHSVSCLRGSSGLTITSNCVWALSGPCKSSCNDYINQLLAKISGSWSYVWKLNLSFELRTLAAYISLIICAC